MDSYILRFFGVAIFTFDVYHFDGDSASSEIAGGSVHNFDRDFNAPIPGTENDYDSWADRPFGFRRP